MNYTQIKQYLGNNLLHGENSRTKNKAAFMQGLTFAQRSAILTVVMPDGSKVWGIDISHWNIPPVDLKRMKDLYGLSFVFIKGCDGSLNTKYYLEHVQAAKDAGIPWGMYVWLYRNANVSIDAQTTAWKNRALADPPPLGVVIDAEWTYYGGVQQNPTATDLRMAHDSYFNKTGDRATTYTARGYSNQYLIGFDWNREELWIASWDVSVPYLPTGATKYTWHQFTSNLDGKLLDPNGNASIDGDYFHGTREEFNARFGGVVPPPPTGEPMRYEATCLYDGTRLRPNSNVNATYITSYPANTKLYGDVLFVATDNSVPNQIPGDTWLQVKDNTGAAIGWVAIIHLGERYCSLVDNGTPPPPAVDDEIEILVNGVSTYHIIGKLQ